MKLILATNNVHKVRELKAMLKPFKTQWDLYSLIDFPNYTPPPETGTTFEENAILKAKDAAEKLGAFAMGDDSGLVVPALKGAPGIYSARYAGENGQSATDKDNRHKLLKEMKEFKDEDRDAYFECAIAIASPEGIEKVVSARCEGKIVETERGGQGFGYDSIFQKHEYSKTFAELEEEVKNRISHRRKALDKILLFLESRVLSN